MPSQWFCKVIGQELGPLSAQQLLAMARKGQLSRDDLVRKERDGQWVPAQNVKGLFDVQPLQLATSTDVTAGIPAAQNAERTSAGRTCPEDEADDLQRWLTNKPIAPRTIRRNPRTPNLAKRLAVGSTIVVVVCFAVVLSILRPWESGTAGTANKLPGAEAKTERSNPVKKRSENLRLPDDFAFAKFTTVQVKTPIHELIKGDHQMMVGGIPLQMILLQGRDKITGLYGNGLRVPNTALTNAVSERLPFFFVPQPFACYRDDKLLGIWDPQKKILRTAAPGEAEPIFKAPDSQPSTPTRTTASPNTLRLPDDFAFAKFTTVQVKTPITDLIDKVQVKLFGTPLQMTLSKGRDKITGLSGKGLEAANTVGEGMEMKGATGDLVLFGELDQSTAMSGPLGRLVLFFVPDPFACYRDEKLLGIWDPQKKALRAAAPGEAEPVLNDSENLDKQRNNGFEDDVEHAFDNSDFDSKFKRYRMPTASDNEARAASLVRFAQRRMQAGDVEAAKMWLKSVIDEYPNTKSGGTASELLAKLQAESTVDPPSHKVPAK